MTEARTTPYANSLFEQPWWLDIVAPGQWEEILIEEKGKVVGRMPVVKYGNVVKHPPYTQTLGIWMSPEIRRSYAKQKRVINQILDALGSYKRVGLQLAVQNDYVLPFRWRGYQVLPRFTYRIEDLTDIDAVYRNFITTKKQNIRTAGRIVHVNEQFNINNLWKVLNSTFSKQDMKPSATQKLIEHIVTECEAINHGKYFEAVDDDGNIHSCVWCVYDNETCYYLIAGSDNSYNAKSFANSLLMWEAIQFAAEHSRVFDFEGSNIEGIEHFFQQFGGKCTPYYSVRKVSMLRKSAEFLIQHSRFFQNAANSFVRAKNFLRFR